MYIQPSSRECEVSHKDGSIRLSPQATVELLAAMEPMELLLRTRRVSAGLRHLVDMLRHLRKLRRKIDLTDLPVKQAGIEQYRLVGRSPE